MSDRRRTGWLRRTPWEKGVALMLRAHKPQWARGIISDHGWALLFMRVDPTNTYNEPAEPAKSAPRLTPAFARREPTIVPDLYHYVPTLPRLAAIVTEPAAVPYGWEWDLRKDQLHVYLVQADGPPLTVCCPVSTSADIGAVRALLADLADRVRARWNPALEVPHA